MQRSGLKKVWNPKRNKKNMPSDTNVKDMPHESEHVDQATGSPVKPTLERSWEVITKEVTSLDEGLVGGWKEDIDTLLVFAGLFSAVVTAFTIESYQWLEPAPEDANVVLLTQIFQKLNNETISPPPQFEVSASAIRINVLWFLSLTIALVDALFALLCKQWIREHVRHTHTRSPAEALALRWLRNQSLEKWHVPAILASLPILLELALFLFLAGVLELLWIRHQVPFAFAMGIVGFAGLYYLGTAIAPAVDILRQALQVSYEAREMRFGRLDSSSPVDFLMRLPPLELVCPYKSPQAWAVFHIFEFTSRTCGSIVRLGLQTLWMREFVSDNVFLPFSRSVSALKDTLKGLPNWSSIDLELLQRSRIDLAPPFYELNAFQWLVTELKDSPIMIPHLQNILETMPLHLVLPAVLGQPFYLPDREWTVGDIEATLRPRLPAPATHKSHYFRVFLDNHRFEPLYSHLLHLIHVLMNAEKVDKKKYGEILSQFQTLWDGPIHGEFRSIGFPVAMRRIEQLTNNPKTSTLGSGLRRLLVQTGESRSTEVDYWITSMHDLGRYIVSLYPLDVIADTTVTTTSPTRGSPSFIESDAGLEFLSLMHHIIIEQEFYRDYYSAKDTLYWMEALNIVRRVHRLPEDYFRTIPGYLPFRLFSKLKEVFSSSSSADCDAFHQYLNPMKEYWHNTFGYQKGAVVELLTEHINNYPQSDPESRPGLDGWTVSPFTLSSSGIELIAFVDNQFEEDPGLKASMSMFWSKDEKEAWTKAMERVRQARGLDGADNIDSEKGY
ncbi:hypothetical protein AAF712_009454 [Marasmius tenuissimus]|uniref:DUF6535 domain-containing protein n=2 Tax=Marasmius tenuissimus TaxID=585030 RepID=A0ABR2ZQR2_9AGAR